MMVWLIFYATGAVCWIAWSVYDANTTGDMDEEELMRTAFGWIVWPVASVAVVASRLGRRERERRQQVEREEREARRLLKQAGVDV